MPSAPTPPTTTKRSVTVYLSVAVGLILLTVGAFIYLFTGK